MLYELNKMAQSYEYLIKALGAFLPFFITLFMAYIAYKQWCLQEHSKLYEKQREKTEKLINPIQKILFDVPDILKNNDDTVNKLYRKLQDIQGYIEDKNYLFNDYFEFIQTKEALEKTKKLLLEIKQFNDPKFSFKRVMEVITGLSRNISLLVFVYSEHKFNKEASITLYGLVALVCISLCKFLIPMSFQMQIRKFYKERVIYIYIIIRSLLEAVKFVLKKMSKSVFGKICVLFRKIISLFEFVCLALVYYIYKKIFKEKECSLDSLSNRSEESFLDSEKV